MASHDGLPFLLTHTSNCATHFVIDERLSWIIFRAMNFKEALKTSCYCLDIKSDTKEGLIEEMINLMVASGQLPETERDGALEAVIERERKMSTGMQNGVAVPHGKTPTMTGLATAFGLKKDGIDFASLDGEPSQIFVMTVSSTLKTGPHLQYLAEISKLLSCPSVREAILQAETAEQIIAILSE
jgi:PTS system nitrogen regulatory IIA component